MKQALIDLFAEGEPNRFGSDDARFRQHETLDSIFRALDLVPTPILVGMNPQSTDIRSNAAGRALFGTSNENLSQSAPEEERPNFRVYSDGREVPPDRLPMQLAGQSGKPVEGTECELRFDDGTIKFIRGRAVPVLGKDGDVRGTIGVFLDVTAVRQNEQQHLLELEEIKHRAKNAIAVVLSVAQATLKSKLERELYEEFEGRLQTVARTVDVFNLDGAPETIREILISTLERRAGRAIGQISMNGPELPVPMKMQTPLGMALHELATNACKYGALSLPDGHVLIRWQRSNQGNMAVLDWIERGGPLVVQPTRRGFGSKLLSQILGSPCGKTTQLIYDERGLECRLFISLV